MPKVVETTAVITATFPANLPANNKVYANIQLDPALAAATQVTVPVNEAWVIEDLYVSTSQTPDAILEFVKNLTDVKLRSAPINGCLVTNVARPKITPVMFGGADILTIVAQNLAAIGASAATITAFIKIKRFIS
ncbi:MAG: hypothetical protein QW618_03185 [Nitrososphaerales archaeon]